MKELRFNYIAFIGCTILLFFIKFQSDGVEGGLDSWQHFLISKYALKYPDLFLDQWNKPIFTLISTWFCRGSIDQLVTFNIFCVSIAALLISLALHAKNYRNSWVVIPFMVFMPELFRNTISGLTEPLNILLIAIFIWLWVRENFITAIILAGFLPFVRTEGFVLCGAVFLLIVFEKRYRLLPFLLIGAVFMDILGYSITGHPFWIISDNPYWRQELNGKFDPGSGPILHYIINAREIFGISLIVLLLFGILRLIFSAIRKKPIDGIFILAISSFVLYFSAHSLIYYWGILGSHGLTRPMALLAPFVALIAYYGVNDLLRKKDHVLRLGVFLLIACFVVINGYKETGFPMPHHYKKTAIPFDKTQINFVKAGNWLKDNHLIDRCIIHQSPFFNCVFNKDPYNVQSSYYIWSIDQKNDWSNDGSIVIWDGFSAKREGNMPLEWLQKNPRFKELIYIKGEERPDSDPDRYDIHIFEKVPLN